MTARLYPCKRREFLRRLSALGFEAPFPSAKHQYVQRGEFTLHIPSNDEYSRPQLRELLNEVGDALGHRISGSDWERLKDGILPEWIGQAAPKRQP